MLNGNDWRYYIVCACIRSYYTKQTVVAVLLLLHNSFWDTNKNEWPWLKVFTSNCQNTGHDGAPSKCNKAQYTETQRSLHKELLEKSCLLLKKTFPELFKGLWNHFLTLILEKSQQPAIVLLLLQPPLVLWPLIPPATPRQILMGPPPHILVMSNLSYLPHVSCMAIYILTTYYANAFSAFTWYN